ncbi:MAG: helix-turn-helix domain-containing protein [Treponema sp.]|nr:helix-turn-helix domain-containing protein [Treponema sp.]
MASFSQRLRYEMEYIGLTRKEFAAKAGIQKRALDAYLEAQQSMPPADKAVQMAAALGLSVEYLVTGKEYRKTMDLSQYMQFRDILDDLAALPDEIMDPIKAVIRAFAASQRKKERSVDEGACPQRDG